MRSARGGAASNDADEVAAHGLCDGCYERTEQEREAKVAQQIGDEVEWELENPPGPNDQAPVPPTLPVRPTGPIATPDWSGRTRTASGAPISDAVRSGGLTMIPKAADSGPWQPGHWRPWENKPGVKAAALTCIGCKRALFLDPSIHTILLDGMVTPSLVCTHPGCTWHVWIRLVDWVPAQAEKEPPVLEPPTTSTFGGESF